MEEKMKEMVKRIAVVAVAVSVILGSVISNPVKAEAKGTAFISKKVSSVTPTIKSAKRSKGKTTVTVSVPTSKVKKLGNVKKITVAYGSTKNSKKFEAKKVTAKVTKRGKNQYTFTLNNKNIASYKNAYITVRFTGKSNWSKLVKVSGKATTTKSSSSTATAKKDKDGTYTTAIKKRFDQGAYATSRTGVYDDGDGWIYVTVSAGYCMKCGRSSLHYYFVVDNALADDSAYHADCHANTMGTIAQIAFDVKTGKVVTGTPEVLKKYPVGTFFTEVE